MRDSPLLFTKLSGAGNDFILLDAAKLGRTASRPALARRLCPRRTSVGADGLLVLDRRGPGGIPSVDHYNADGSRAFCANGSRCAAWWMFRRGWTGKRMRFLSSGKPVDAVVLGSRGLAARVRVEMPPARLLRSLRLKALGRTLRVLLIDTGVPHAVIRVSRLDSFPVEALGRALRGHAAFGKAGANVDFVSAGRGSLGLRTYERGVEAETLACGTGAVAAAVASWVWDRRRSPARVAVRGGAVLSVSFRPEPQGVFSGVGLEGPAEIVFEGEVRP